MLSGRPEYTTQALGRSRNQKMYDQKRSPFRCRKQRKRKSDMTLSRAELVQQGEILVHLGFRV